MNRLAVAVDRSIQIPAAFDLHACLVRPPRAVAHPQVRSDPLLELGSVGLDPAENGDVIDRDAAILQHKFKIAVADVGLEIPAHGPKDHLGSVLSALELLAPIPDRRPRFAPNRTDPTRGAAAPKPRNRAPASGWQIARRNTPTPARE